MAGRSSRSPAGHGVHGTSPISPASRLGEVLNMHTAPSPNPRAQRVPYSSPNYDPSRRNLYAPTPQGGHSAAHGDATMGNGVGASRSSPIVPSTASSRSASRAASISFVPRIVRGNFSERAEASASSSHGATISGRQPLSSPTRPRRPSGAVAAALLGTHRSASAPSPTSTVVPPPSHVISFSRPSYLEHSALRHYIQSEATPGVPPDRYRFDSLHTGAPATSLSRARGVRSSSRDTDSDEESNASTGERDRTVSPPRVAQRKPAEPFMHLPTRWSDQDRCPSLSVSADGRDLTFHGVPSTGEKDAAAARTNFPIPAACGVYYYEIEILNKGQRGHISVGFGTNSVRLSRLPGWEGHSWGYHGDDGNSFASEREGSSYGPKFTTGDVVGCGIEYNQSRAFFTKNGRYLGPVFENLVAAGDLYPSVGLRTHGEAIRANFGHEPFMFDIDAHVEQERNRTWGRIQSTPVSWSTHGDAATFTVHQEDVSEAVSTVATTSHAGGEDSVELGKPINELILAYLAHHGYAKTARAFKGQNDARGAVLPAVVSPAPAPAPAEDTAMETDADVVPSASTFSVPDASSSSAPAPATDFELGAGAALMQDDTLKRQKIVHSIVGGDIDTALEGTRTHYPSVLERQEGLVLFKLRCRKFVELVLDAAAALRDVKEEEARGKGKDDVSNGVGILDGESMDVDDDSSVGAPVLNGNSTPTVTPIKPAKTKPAPATISLSTASYQMALTNALTYGQSLQADYKADARPDVQAIFKRTLSLVAYDDPLADDPRVPEAVKEMAGQAARDHLAEELNRAILESQGRPPHPALERLYRHTQACVMQLGWLGVGAAAFADMPKEFLDA